MKRKTILTIIITIVAILLFKTLRKETQSLAKSFKTLRKETQSLAKSLKQQGTEEW